MFERRMIMRKEFQLAKESTSSAYEWGGRDYVEGSIKIKLLEELQAT
jgi:hypothetical protein